MWERLVTRAKGNDVMGKILEGSRARTMEQKEVAVHSLYRTCFGSKTRLRVVTCSRLAQTRCFEFG